MSVLSNNARPISSLPLATSLNANDEILLQAYSSTKPGGVTKRVNYSTFTSSILDPSHFNPYTGQVHFKNDNDIFSGSFYSPDNKIADFYSVDIRNGGLYVVGNTNLIGGFTGYTITALTRFLGQLTGSLSGDLTGDIYSPTNVKILENGSGTVKNAFFYGTGSYSKTSSIASRNGAPIGGTTGQVLAKNSNTNYDLTWATVSGVSSVTAAAVTASIHSAITSSIGGTVAGYIPVFNGKYKLTTSSITQTQSPSVVTITGYDLKTSSGNTYSGSLTSPHGSYSLETPNEAVVIEGHLYPSFLLHLTASGHVTMSLCNGQSSTVLIKNSGNNNITKWSGSLDKGSTANTKIYWKSGLSASLSRVNGGKDVITFVNINNYIFGSAITSFS